MIRKVIHKKVKVLLFFIAATLGATAQNTNAFSVKQAVDYATKNSIQVKNALQDIQLQKQTNREFTANAYPQVSGSMQLNNFLVIPTSVLPGEVFGQPAGTKIPVQFGTKYNATGSLDVSQILFDGQVFVGLQARTAAMNLATKQAEVTQEQIKANVYKIYYQLAVAKKQIGAIDANIVRFEKLLHDVKEIYKNGFAERLDIDKVQVQLNNLTTEKQKIENQIAAGNAGLKFLMNMPQKDILILTDSITETVLKENILTDSIDYKQRKEMQVLTLAQELNEYNVRRYKLAALPSVVAFASYQKNAQRQKLNLFGKEDWFTTSLIGVKVNVPIFDGNARKAKMAKAKIEVDKIKNNIDLLKQSIDYDVNTSKLNMTSALLTIDVQKQNMALAEKVYNTTKKKYEQGLGSNQEIYTAQAELKVAQTNYYSALYDAINAKIDYLKAVGKL
ncbi:MAG: TolC family protein [Ferruginibacter sp.]|nr:TolC family protein [Ferruginibacter sp.]